MRHVVTAAFRSKAALLLAAWAGLVACHITPASAGNTAFLSRSGSGNCLSMTTACTTMTTAVAAAGAGGEVICLDKGNYSISSITITFGITISCGDGLWEAPGQVITINPPVGSTVVIEGLVSDSIGSAGTIMHFGGQGTLHLRRVRIGNATGGHGLSFAPTGPAQLLVTDSYFYNMIGNSGVLAGINIKPGSGVSANITIERTRIERNRFGLFLDGTGGGSIGGVIKDSLVSAGFFNGISASTSGTNVGLVVDNTIVSGNNIGIAAGGTNGFILVRRSTITTNSQGLSAGGGAAIVTYKDNLLNNNGNDGAFSFSIPLQ